MLFRGLQVGANVQDQQQHRTQQNYGMDAHGGPVELPEFGAGRGLGGGTEGAIAKLIQSGSDAEVREEAERRQHERVEEQPSAPVER